jgi:crotonobetainyl-CoA:carnitine CoA-transferase CaiB-like acyl-CoA transferase
VPGFEGLADPVYETNAGRIVDMLALNVKLAECTRKYSTPELLETFRAATIPIAKVQGVLEVCEDPAVKPKLLHSTDPRTGFQVTLAPPPVMTDFLKSQEQTMSFPPRHGEHNAAIYGGSLGMSDAELEQLRTEGVI